MFIIGAYSLIVLSVVLESVFFDIAQVLLSALNTLCVVGFIEIALLCWVDISL